MRPFGDRLILGNELNKPLCALADQAIESGRGLLGARDSGTQLKLIGHIDEIIYIKESYVNLIHFLQVYHMTNKLHLGSDAQFPRIPLAGLLTSRNTLQQTLVAGIRRLLIHIRDLHHVPVTTLLDEVKFYDQAVVRRQPVRNRHLRDTIVCERVRHAQVINLYSFCKMWCPLIILVWVFTEKNFVKKIFGKFCNFFEKIGVCITIFINFLLSILSV